MKLVKEDLGNILKQNKLMKEEFNKFLEISIKSFVKDGYADIEIFNTIQNFLKSNEIGNMIKYKIAHNKKKWNINF